MILHKEIIIKTQKKLNKLKHNKTCKQNPYKQYLRIKRNIQRTNRHKFNKQTIKNPKLPKAYDEIKRKNQKKKNSFKKNVKVVIVATFTMHQLSTTCTLKVEGRYYHHNKGKST